MVHRLADVIGIPLPTTHVGKLPRPSWFTYNFEDRDPVEAMAADQVVEESYHDAVKVVLKDQETLGVDIPTDTCLRYDSGDQRTIGNWWTNAICRIGGVRRGTSRPKDAKPVIQSVISREHWREVLLHYPMEASLPTWQEPYVWPFWYIVEDQLSVGKLESSCVNFFEISQRYSTKPVKFSCVDASMGGYMTLRDSDNNKHFSNDRDVFFALCKIYNQVLKALGKAGCKVIQLDWPLGGIHHVANRAKVSEGIWKDMIDGFNEEVKGVESQIWMHFCFGGAGGSLRLNCIETMKHLGDCNADVIQVEAGSSGGEFLDAELSNWNEYCPDKDFAVGVVAPLTLMGEKLQSVAEIIRKALRYVPPERLAVTTDEGFREIGRRASLDKLGLMVEAARLVRGEAYGPVPKTKVVSLVEAS